MFIKRSTEGRVCSTIFVKKMLRINDSNCFEVVNLVTTCRVSFISVRFGIAVCFGIAVRVGIAV